ncbi:unnamed protein product [Cylindrotheca closterium]|uniref:Uncharacterized protein n=1 Tax=Cylindrotheca closterium TaxID=2856 RepID=A0AAD2CNN8_9STRA|nr:unnamed protein product [Cylindrotheca closterium]
MTNIFTIQDLIKTEGTFADRLNPCPPGCKWREDQLQSWYKQAKENLVEGDGEEVVDHRKAENPFESRYGQGWEEELRKVLHRNGSVSIAHQVDHIVHESAQTMTGTKPEDDWRFYHDALTLMTSADLIDYMKAKGIYHRWILPEQGLFEDDTALKHYRGRPPGDSPELMPWDNNLNQDAHVSVEQHV